MIHCCTLLDFSLWILKLISPLSKFSHTTVRWSENSLVVYHPVSKISPIDPILRQLNPVINFTLYFNKKKSIFLFLKWSFPLRFQTKIFYPILISFKCSTYLAYKDFFNPITLSILGEKFKSLSSSSCTFFHSFSYLSFLRCQIRNKNQLKKEPEMQIIRQRNFGYGKSNSESGAKRFTKYIYTGTFVT